MTEEWIRDVADATAKGYAERQTQGEGIWKKGDVIVENQMSFSDGFVEGWAMAQEYFRRICVDYKGDKERLESYYATVFYGMFTSQSNFKGMEDAFPKTCEFIKILEARQVGECRDL